MAADVGVNTAVAKFLRRNPRTPTDTSSQDYDLIQDAQQAQNYAFRNDTAYAQTTASTMVGKKLSPMPTNRGVRIRRRSETGGGGISGSAHIASSSFQAIEKNGDLMSENPKVRRDGRCSSSLGYSLAQLQDDRFDSLLQMRAKTLLKCISSVLVLSCEVQLILALLIFAFAPTWRGISVMLNLSLMLYLFPFFPQAGLLRLSRLQRSKSSLLLKLIAMLIQGRLFSCFTSFIFILVGRIPKLIQLLIPALIGMSVLIFETKSQAYVVDWTATSTTRRSQLPQINKNVNVSKQQVWLKRVLAPYSLSSSSSSSSSPLASVGVDGTSGFELR